MDRRGASLLCALLIAAGCNGSSSRAQFISIATGGTGGVYYPYGGGLAKVLNENLPGIRASAEVTAASVDNLKLIRDGTRQSLGASESADSLKDRKIDAFFWSGGLPTAAVQDLSHSPGITIRLIPTAQL